MRVVKSILLAPFIIPFIIVWIAVVFSGSLLAVPVAYVLDKVFGWNPLEKAQDGSVNMEFVVLCGLSGSLRWRWGLACVRLVNFQVPPPAASKFSLTDQPRGGVIHLMARRAIIMERGAP
jgi:hypothetical protein